MKENNDWPDVGRGQLVRRLNFDCAGELPVRSISCPAYSTLLFKKSHLSSLNDTQYFWNTLQTQVNKVSINSRVSHHNNISSIMILLPQIIFFISYHDIIGGSLDNG